MTIPPATVVEILAGRVVLVVLTRRLALDLLVLEAGPVAFVATPTRPHGDTSGHEGSASPGGGAGTVSKVPPT